VSREWRNRYQNEVDQEKKGVDSRDIVQPTEMSDHAKCDRSFRPADSL